MFTAPKQTAKSVKKAAQSRDANAVTILTAGCHFSGKLYCRGSSRIGGKIDGQIISEGLLIIEEEAVITAEIKADEAIIQGTVQGKLHATGRVELCASSRFDGDITTPVLIVREGACFNGRSAMVQPEAASTTPRIVASQGRDVKNDAQPNIEHDDKPEIAVMKAPEISVPT